MVQQQCSNCRFWRKAVQDGLCHRHAPEPIQGQDQRWPVTFSRDWCGEWEFVQMEIKGPEVTITHYLGGEL